MTKIITSSIISPQIEVWICTGVVATVQTHNAFNFGSQNCLAEHLFRRLDLH